MDDGFHPTPPIPDAEPASPPGRRSAPDDIWDRIRQDYLAGASAPEVGRRHGVSESALRHRAAREGWRRVDQPWMPPDPREPWDCGLALETRVEGNLDRIEPRDLYHLADERMAVAVLRGNAIEAMRWHRVREAMDQDAEELARWIAGEEARADVRRDELEATERLAAIDPDAGPVPVP